MFRDRRASSNRGKPTAAQGSKPKSTTRGGVLARTALGGKKRERLKALADLRGQSVEETAEQIASNLLRSIPGSLGGYQGVDFSELEVAECGFSQGVPWLKTASGRVFYEHPATARDALMYVLLRDRVPAKLGPETLVVASHVIRRYLHGADALPDGARVAVDAGCYTGLKPLAYADRIGAGGKVVAIEMMPDNYDLLTRNVAANDMAQRVATVHCALSDQTGSVMTRRLRKQQATIAEGLDQLQGFGEECVVPMSTLANIFDETLDGRAVDFLNVQVNGHELAVLEGLGRWTDRVHTFSVTSPYTRAGSRLRDDVVNWFRDHQIPVIEVGETSVRAQRQHH